MTSVAAMQMIDRRQFVASAGLASGALLLPGCAATVTPPPPPRLTCLAPPPVSRERVIRTVVGLRPYRAGGFVVREERIGDTRLVHNYGHGGAGITLSWGTSRLAAGLGLQGHSGPVAVIGAGAVGLATARLVQEAGFAVSVYAAALPPETTSNIAGGQIMPFGHYRSREVTPEWHRQFMAALDYSWRRFQIMAGEEYGIRWAPTYAATAGGPPHADVAALMVGRRDLPPGAHPFGDRTMRRYEAMYVETGRYLRQLQRDIAVAGGRIQVRSFAAPAEIGALPERLVFNCTGLGARALFGDEQLRPARGQLVVVAPQREVGYAYTMDEGYMFPRPDGLLLGGTFDLDDWSTEPDPATTARILSAHARIAADWRCPA